MGELGTEVEMPAIPEAALASAESEASEPLPALDTQLIPTEVELQVTADKPKLRFAEDILGPKPAKPGAKPRRKKKKSTYDREGAEERVRPLKQRRGLEILEGEEDY